MFGKIVIYFTVIFFFVSPSVSAQTCGDCDCYHFPIPEKCLKCCGFETGTISSVTKSEIVLSHPAPPGKKTETVFGLSPNAKVNGVLKQGEKATVYYRREGSIAARIDLTEALQGLLRPAHEPDPPNPCGSFPIPREALKIYLGNSVAWTSASEHTVLEMGGADILALRRAIKGLALSAKVYDKDGRVVAQIVDNHFYINPENFFRVETPDEHSLVVYDQHATKVLDVRYLNPSSVRVLGVFYYPRTLPVRIAENQTLIGTNRFSEYCFGNGQVDIAVGVRSAH